MTPEKVVLALTLTRSPAQKPAYKDLGRNGKDRHHAQGHLYFGF
ncbi:hypothetical protein OFW50_01060 [Lacticaseibacillus chiayiensis]|uniref:Uncharacterized protein n=1 Tax=Lacticaseibacillus chiayiensis TaxID=2100821 RepID=A0ABY6H6H7_9LACO|nr:hypothetical protein [Lacticaseibacillus chiayiensis]UYN56728.1 hypothetical protein OFW50_01060 [Lacticaseibacillus chiayiensis]